MDSGREHIKQRKTSFINTIIMTQSHSWRTYDNRVINMEEMSHQHMSNIFYFVNNIVPNYYPDSTRNYISKWLLIRFDNVILPFCPDPNFKNEKDYLLRMGYLKENNDIVVNGEKIGSYE